MSLSLQRKASSYKRILLACSEHQIAGIQRQCHCYCLELGTDNMELFFTAISEFLLLSVQRFFGSRSWPEACQDDLKGVRLSSREVCYEKPDQKWSCLGLLFRAPIKNFISFTLLFSEDGGRRTASMLFRPSLFPKTVLLAPLRKSISRFSSFTGNYFPFVRLMQSVER